MDGTVLAARARRGRLRFAVGVAAGLIAAILVGEAFVRLQPPEDLKPYLGDDSPRSGIYRPDPRLRVDYRSAGEYVPFEAPRIAELSPLNSREPTWLFFGNSFAQELYLSARKALPSHRVLFFREAKDEFHMRVAQARLLLESGLRPERMFFTLIPVEVARYVQRPLPWVNVNRNGAIGYRFRMPGRPFDDLLTHSWLVRTAWIRSRQHQADPTFRMSRIVETVPQGALDDFELMFGVLGELSRKHGVPATVVLLPDRRQILGQSSFRLQNELAKLVEAAGLDRFDPRDVLLGFPDKRALYERDWHHTEIGDRLLFEALLKHLQEPVPAAPRREASP